MKKHRIYLSAYCEEDAEIMADWSEDDEYMRNLDTDYFRPHSANYLKENIQDIEKDSSMIEFAIRTTKEKELIGFVCLHSIEWNNRCAIMAAGIGNPEYRSKGYGVESIQLLLNYAFNELNLNRVGLDVISNNTKAINVYTNIGFTNEGIIRKSVLRDGKQYDRIMMGILLEEWRENWTIDGKNFFIRKFTMDDIPAVVDIHNENNPDKTTVEEMMTYELNRSPDRILVQYVIDFDGKVVAYGDCGEVNATTTEDAFHCWVTVNPKFGAKGFGVRLLEEFENFSRKHNMYRIETGMSAEQPHSIQWMEKRGFEFLGSIYELNLDLNSINLDSAMDTRLDDYEVKALGEEAFDNTVIENLYTTLAKPLLSMVVFPGGATMNPSYEEFRNMFIDCPEANNAGQIVAKFNDKFIAYCDLFLEECSDYAYISYIDLHREYLNIGIEKALILYAIKVAKERGYSTIKTHYEEGSVLQSVIDEFLVFGGIQSPGRMIWSKSFK